MSDQEFLKERYSKLNAQRDRHSEPVVEAKPVPSVEPVETTAHKYADGFDPMPALRRFGRWFWAHQKQGTILDAKGCQKNQFGNDDLTSLQFRSSAYRHLPQNINHDWD